MLDAPTTTHNPSSCHGTAEQSVHFCTPRSQQPQPASTNRWAVEDIEALFALPLPELMFRAQQVHREHFDPAEVEFATLLSIKTGGCPEDCGYCPQSVHHETPVEATKLMEADAVREAALKAKAAGATRFCMGAAWRAPKDRDIENVVTLIKTVKEVGLEACCTLGMLTKEHAVELKEAGLDYYNHNLDTAPENYGNIITTRDYQDRLDTLENVRNVGVSVCSGGIIGMGENRRQRAELIGQLANLHPHYPDSVPINNLVKVEGTPLAEVDDIDPLEFVRMIAVARITMPEARVRLSAGRTAMADTMQAMCFMAGANSIFYGEKLLTTGNPDVEADMQLIERLGMRAGKQQA
ncbi:MULTISPECIES: biotin synthase BioB [Brachymonas]|uniref:biotin synthase BioB n=1 Tax=Brachymonas TaxID=28219 RepID=UPI00168EBE09|nr:biotin synthase BioB [Brachymonas sp. J145]MEE1653493.1 biotin synthase BioB [Brachymonas sp. J145]NLX17194.1 biotin synthase BioB [Ramlibacter sp.]